MRLPRKLFVITLCAVFFSAGTALAEDKKPKPKAKGDKTGEMTEISDFGKDVIEADDLSRDMGMIQELPSDLGGSLIQLRQTFTDELVRSAEDL